MKQSLKAQILEGRLFYTDIDKYNEFLSKNEGKYITVKLDSDKQRSQAQHQYYWFLCLVFAVHISDTTENVHNRNKIMFILPKIHPGMAMHPDRVYQLSGTELDSIARYFTFTRSTTKETTASYTEIIELFKKHAEEKECFMPTPDQITEEMKQHYNSEYRKFKKA